MHIPRYLNLYPAESKAIYRLLIEIYLGAMTEKEKILASAALAWAYGAKFGLADEPQSQQKLLSSAANFWFTFQKRESSIEVPRAKPFEAVRRYLSDCIKAGYNDPRDSVSDDEAKMRVAINSCMYRILCTVETGTRNPLSCIRFGILRNVISRASGLEYAYRVRAEAARCRGTLSPKHEVGIADEEVMQLFNALK